MRGILSYFPSQDGVVVVELLTTSVVYALEVVTNYKVPTYKYLWYLGTYSWLLIEFLCQFQLSVGVGRLRVGHVKHKDGDPLSEGSPRG